MIEEKIKAVIRDVPDFPKEGIVFKDITPIMLDAALSNEIVDHLVEIYTRTNRLIRLPVLKVAVFCLVIRWPCASEFPLY